MPSCGIDQNDLAIVDRRDLDAVDAGNGNAVTSGGFDIAHADTTGRRYEIGVAIERKDVPQGFAGPDRGTGHARIGVNTQCVVIARHAGGQNDEPARPVAPWERP